MQKMAFTVRLKESWRYAPLKKEYLLVIGSDSVTLLKSLLSLVKPGTDMALDINEVRIHQRPGVPR